MGRLVNEKIIFLFEEKAIECQSQSESQAKTQSQSETETVTEDS